MRFEHHPLLSAIIADRCSRVRRREDGIVELTERRSSTGIGNRSFNAPASRAQAPSKATQPPAAREPRRHSIARALLSVPARILDAFVEGCALYAIAMNPSAFWCWSQNADRDDPMDDAAGDSLRPRQSKRMCPEPGQKLPIIQSSISGNE
jgi:hypothetical protein